MSTRLIFALTFIGLCLAVFFWATTLDDNRIEGRIEQINIPQLMIGHNDDTGNEMKLRTVLINDETVVTGLADDVQQLRTGQYVTVELVPDGNLNIAVSIHVTSD
ncbi:MAG: hypothetical protein LPJ96_03865 [Exiguobacterium sp.]|uniref:DUF5666 domain-containing protein n=1 Tax=Exiguobacterium alkaliphilum TaxID=1428684 RepID=A0ABT2KZ95_9BACL|nr:MULTISPECIES: hypothetical protein [Exiguobacterium]MDX5322724.1 hypothetical protein [Exiguobacterium sp.]KDN58034.1 hypothetical protein DI14_03155 [Exiguobacterium sp. AB2]MCT4795339.1 hypothetical protein [Exiguobacterium alkaliphilum]MDX5424468.1 hypothetical protein [Exiguobacterium sp.]MDX6771969.1 hypothetical protein [Exiguobacterium sp.]